MMIDELIHKEKPNTWLKGSLKEQNGTLQNVIHGRTEKVQNEVIERILETQLNLCLQDVMLLSCKVLKGLSRTLKATQVLECLEEVEQELDEPKKKSGQRNNHRKAESGALPVARILRTVGLMRKGEGRNPQDSLVEAPIVKSMTGELEVCVVVDTGSIANIIGAIQALEVYGIAGLGVQCNTWIPETTIYITKGMILMSGVLLIVEEAAFNVILGMPWLKDNLRAVFKRVGGAICSGLAADAIQGKVIQNGNGEEKGQNKGSKGPGSPQ